MLYTTISHTTIPILCRSSLCHQNNSLRHGHCGVHTLTRQKCFGSTKRTYTICSSWLLLSLFSYSMGKIALLFFTFLVSCGRITPSSHSLPDEKNAELSSFSLYIHTKNNYHSVISYITTKTFLLELRSNH